MDLRNEGKTIVNVPTLDRQAQRGQGIYTTSKPFGDA